MSLHLTGLRVENYKRITLADVTFDAAEGGVVALMGENESGKTSFLDAFEALIAGRKAPKQTMPVHLGKDQSKLVATFHDSDGVTLTVTRIYKTNGSTSIEVRQDGLKVARADDILSRLYSHVALDPLAFAQLDSKRQVETLLALIGFDPAKLDEEARNVYATRTSVGQEVDRLAGQLASFPDRDDEIADAELVDVAAVQDELERARSANEARSTWQDNASEGYRIARVIEDQIQGLRDQIAKLEEQAADRIRDADSLEKMFEESSDKPTADLFDRISSADATNEAIREQRRRRLVEEQLATQKEIRAAHTARLEEIRQEKAAGFASANMPIPGLTVEDGEVYLDGTPFSQTSAGGKLRTSTAIAMALNPDLRAIIIRDGSLLDAKNRAIIDNLARSNDFTVLMEIVDQNAPAGIVFEDGTAKVRA